MSKKHSQRRPHRQHEHRIQVALIEWVEWHLNRYPGLDLLYAVPNGGHRYRAVAAKLKAEGVRAGVPDLCLPVARHGAHGLYIEMKAPGGKESEHQHWWRQRLTEEGYRAVVCVGLDEAMTALKSYLG